MKMEQTECSEMSAYKIQTPGNYPEQNIQQVFSTHFCNTSASWRGSECSHVTEHVNQTFGR